MKTLDELKSFYESAMMPDILTLERARKKVLASVLRNGFFVTAGVGILAFIFYSWRMKIDDLLALTAFGLIAGLGAVYWFGIRSYRTEFKLKIIDRIVKFIDESLSYAPDSRIEKSLYTQSKIFLHSVDRYRGDDLVTGRIGETDIRFSELHTEYETRTTDSRGNTRREWHTIFKGLFFVGDFNKNFSGTTFVLPDTAERLLGGFGKMLQSKNMSRPDLVKMEDPVFEKLFVVYSTDQIEARYILSTSLMKRITEFSQMHKKKIFLSFVDSKIFVAISYHKNLFEPNIFRTLIDFEPIKVYFEDLQLAVSLVEELNLNLRIWSKQ